MMEAVRPSETSVNFNETTRRYISEGSNLSEFSRFHMKQYKYKEQKRNDISDMSTLNEYAI
jgi:hypothetical protein